MFYIANPCSQLFHQSLSSGPPVPPKQSLDIFTPTVGPQTSREPFIVNNTDRTVNNTQLPTGVSTPRPNPEHIIVISPDQAHVSPRLYGKILFRYLSVIYLLFLLQLPSLYSSRVDRIFEEVDLTLPEIEGMVLELASQGLKRSQIKKDSESSLVDKRLASTWRSFIDSVTREWKIFNIISVLLSRYVNSFSSYTHSKSDLFIIAPFWLSCKLKVQLKIR